MGVGKTGIVINNKPSLRSAGFTLALLLLWIVQARAQVLDNSQSFYASVETGSGNAYQYNLGTNGSQIQASPGIGAPAELAEDGSGNLLLANDTGSGPYDGFSSVTGYSGVEEYLGGNLSSTPINLAPLPANLENFSATAVAINASSGNIYTITKPYALSTQSTYASSAAYPGENLITEYTSASSVPTVIAGFVNDTPTAQGDSAADRIAINQTTGNLFVSDISYGLIHEYSSAGVLITNFVVNVGGEGQIAADNLGTVYVAENNGVIAINSATGAQSNVITDNGLNAAINFPGVAPRDYSLWVNSNNNLFVNAQIDVNFSSYEDVMEEYSSTGTDLGTLFTQTNSPLQNSTPSDILVVGAIPEPSTYTLFGLGVLALIVIARRKTA